MEDTIKTMETETLENTEAIAASKAKEIQEQINQYLTQLSLERLQVVSDFVAYLADKEIEEATEELQEIPSLFETIKKNRETTSKEQLVNWRTVRSDVSSSLVF